MSRHWRPEVIHGYAPPRPKVRGVLPLLLLGVVFAAVVGWTAWRSWPAAPVESGLSSEIEWNAVQAVSTRTPDAQDIEWQKRAHDPSPVIASPEGPQQLGEGGPISPTGNLYIIDGDTFAIGKERIRIAGMDAPETHPPRCMREAQLGLAAAAKLEQLLESGTVTMGPATRDKYGRELRQVFVDGVDVAQTMIAAGLASSYEGKKRQSWC
jgi:endonuclease YncB( thermonuclease family)